MTRRRHGLSRWATDPGPTFVGDFGGQPELVTVNAGSNDLTVISDFEGPRSDHQHDRLRRRRPGCGLRLRSRAAVWRTWWWATRGDGALALFEGGADGLSLMSVENEPNLPSPTALAFSTLTGGQVEFYAATAGRESAELVSLSLGFETSPAIGPSALSPSPSTVVQLVSLRDTSLPLVATVLDADDRGLGRRRGFRLCRVAGAVGVGERAGVGDLGGARFGRPRGLAVVRRPMCRHRRRRPGREPPRRCRRCSRRGSGSCWVSTRRSRSFAARILKVYSVPAGCPPRRKGRPRSRHPVRYLREARRA